MIDDVLKLDFVVFLYYVVISDCRLFTRPLCSSPVTFPDVSSPAISSVVIFTALPTLNAGRSSHEKVSVHPSVCLSNA